MTFNSLSYAVFLAVVTGAVWRLRHRDQNRLLLAASYLFYGAWDWRYLALLMASTVIGYTAGITLESTDDPARRRAIMMSRVALNLAILGVFKYANFFLASAVAGLEAVGLSGTEPSLRIILPIAISY